MQIPKAIAVTVRIDVPALTDYIAYMRERDARDSDAAALAGRIRQATNKLRKTTARLKQSVEQTKTVEE